MGRSRSRRSTWTPRPGRRSTRSRFLRKFPALSDKVGAQRRPSGVPVRELSEGAGWENLTSTRTSSRGSGAGRHRRLPSRRGCGELWRTCVVRAGFAASSEAVAAPVAAVAPSAATLQPEEPGETFGPEELRGGVRRDLRPEEFEEEFGSESDMGELTRSVRSRASCCAAGHRRGQGPRGFDKLIAAPDAPKPGIVIRATTRCSPAARRRPTRPPRTPPRLCSSADADFTADLAALGDGVAKAWVNMDAMGSLTGVTGLGAFGLLGVGGSNPAAEEHRRAHVVRPRFDGDDALEVRGASTGASTLKAPDKPLQGFTELPEDSVVAVGLAGGRHSGGRVLRLAARDDRRHGRRRSRGWLRRHGRRGRARAGHRSARRPRGAAREQLRRRDEGRPHRTDEAGAGRAGDHGRPTGGRGSRQDRQGDERRASRTFPPCIG